MSKQIKFIPHSKDVAELTEGQFVPASRAMPEWWRATKPMFGEKLSFNGNATNFTVKKCVPFLDALTSGYMFILQQDIVVMDSPANPELPFIDWKSDKIAAVTDHSLDQIGEFQVSEAYVRHVFKWHNDWEVSTPRGYGAVFSHPPNRFDLPFRTMTGFVDTDSYQTPVQFPFVLEKTFRGIIRAGTPVAHILPVKRNSWTSSYEPFDELAVDKKSFNFRKSIHSSYRNFNWFKKSYK